MNTKKSLAFIVELLWLFIMLILVIVTVTQIFVMSRSWSLRAGDLTQAVILAENAAEIASASPTAGSLRDNLQTSPNAAGQAGDAVISDDGSEGEVYIAETFTGEDGSEGSYIVKVTRSLPEGGSVQDPGEGIYAEDLIEVYRHDGSSEAVTVAEDAEPLYTLRSGTFFKADQIRKEAQP